MVQSLTFGNSQSLAIDDRLSVFSELDIENSIDSLREPGRDDQSEGRNEDAESEVPGPTDGPKCPAELTRIGGVFT